jgi:hypothetical protein
MTVDPRPTDPYLYIIMRTDLDSLGRGKSCAQAAHAANNMAHWVEQDDDPEVKRLYGLWRGAGDRRPGAIAFGNTLVLGATELQMRIAVEWLGKNGHPCGVVHDESYPLRDGEVTHLIPLDTCAWAFGSKGALEPFLGRLGLLINDPPPRPPRDG